MDVPSGSVGAGGPGRAEPAPDAPAETPAPPGGDENAELSADLSAVLAAAAQGDESAWRVVIAHYSRRVFALARSRVRSPELAEEVTQSVFATVAAKLGSGGYSEQGRFESWLFRVVMNRVRDEGRRAARQAIPTDPASLGVGTPASGTDPALRGTGPDAGTLAALRGAMAELSDQDRDVIELRHHGQMSFKAMAELLGEPLGTLLARHHRALRKLHSLITGGVEGAGGAGPEADRAAQIAGRIGPGGPGVGSGGSKGGRHS